MAEIPARLLPTLVAVEDALEPWSGGGWKPDVIKAAVLAAAPPIETRVREEICRDLWSLRAGYDKRTDDDDHEANAVMRALFQACRRVDERTTRILRNRAADEGDGTV